MFFKKKAVELINPITYEVMKYDGITYISQFMHGIRPISISTMYRDLKAEREALAKHKFTLFKWFE